MTQITNARWKKASENKRMAVLGQNYGLPNLASWLNTDQEQIRTEE